ncbi:hypothetical protein Dimus_000794 [Dionaea muscipula]
MSSKKEEKSQAAADRIKAAAMSAAKGLSRAQAERAAAAAARNVNAYGQKEEGPSRWQERKEAKRQMYLMSTEKAVRLGERKDLKMPIVNGTTSQCQKCFQVGHWTYECKNERVYISRPSRSQQLKNPRLRQKPLSPAELDEADARKEQSQNEDEKHRKKIKRKQRSDTESGSDSEASVFDSQSESSSAAGSDSSSEESASSYSSLSDSEEERRRRKRKKNKQQKQKKGRKKRYSSSSESSDYESMSDADSDDESSQRKGRSRSHRC